MRRGDFYEVVCTLCEYHHGSMSSGYRTPKHNAAVGGKPTSRHLEGLAFDIVLDTMHPEARTNFVKAVQALELGAEDEGDHVHVQLRRTGRLSRPTPT